MLNAWKPNEGGVYNGELVEQFWKDMSPYLPQDWELQQHLGIHQDPQTAVASLEIDLSEQTDRRAYFAATLCRCSVAAVCR